MPEAYAQPHPDRANLSRRQGGPVAGCTKIRHGRRVCWEAGAFSVPPHPVRLQALGVFGLWALKALSVASLPGLASSPPIRKTTARLRHLALVLPLAAVIGMAVYGWRLSVAHDGLRAATTAQAGLRAMQLTDARADQIESLLNGVDIVLRQFRDHWAAGNPDAARATVQSALAAVPPDSIRNFAIASAEGALLFSMKPVQTPPDGPRTGVDRDYFKFHSRQAVDQSFLNPPVVGRALGAWVIQLTRPVLQDGRFDGVALVALSPHYLSAALAKTAVAPDDVISLVFNDGTFAARSRDLDKVLGTRLPADRSFLQPGAPGSGVVRLVAFTDQRPRLYAWRRLSGYPLIVNVGLDEAAILAPVDTEIALSTLHTGIGLALMALPVGATADGILLVGPPGRVLDSNRRFKAMWQIPDGLSRADEDDRLLAHVRDRLPDPDAFMQQVESLYPSDEQRTAVIHFKDGRVFERHTQPVLLDDLQARLWSFRDITEQRRAEDQLKANETRLRAIFDGARDGILVADGQTRCFIDANPAICAMLGHDRAQLLRMGVAGRGRAGQPRDHPGAAAVGRAGRRYCRGRAGGGGPCAEPGLRPGADGHADAHDGRPGRHPAPATTAQRRKSAGGRDNGQRLRRRPGALPGGRHERLSLQAHRRGSVFLTPCCAGWTGRRPERTQPAQTTAPALPVRSGLTIDPTRA